MKKKQARNNNRRITLIELLIGVLLIIVVLVGAFTLFNSLDRLKIADDATFQTVITPSSIPTPTPIVNQPTLYFAREGSTTPLASISFSKGQSIPLSLYYSASNTLTNGYDITVTAPSNLTITNIAGGDSAVNFDASLIETNNINKANNSARIAKAITSISNANSGTILRLAVITFTAAPTPTNGFQVISFSGPNSSSPAIVSAINTKSFVSVKTAPFSYTIGQNTANTTQFIFSLALTGRTSQRPVEIELFDSNNQPLPIKTGTVDFSKTTNRFKGTVDMGSLAAGNYAVKVKTPKYLKKLIPGIQTITKGRTAPYIIPPVTLIVGDANNDNRINVLDLNIWLGCYQGKENEKSCSSVDFNDNGKIRDDLADGNLIIKSFEIREGD
ncbi:MAG: hypothetical protein Q7S38_00645 [bacterium]|nr:hypothetical protein [bacterium]